MGEIAFRQGDEARGFGIEQGLAVIAEHDLHDVGSVAVEEGGEGFGFEHPVLPIEEAEGFGGGRLHASRAGEIAPVGGIDQQAERTREQGGAALVEVIPGEQEIEQLEREGRGGGGIRHVLAESVADGFLRLVQAIEKIGEGRTLADLLAKRAEARADGGPR